jgi:hypothetical protein
MLHERLAPAAAILVALTIAPLNGRAGETTDIPWKLDEKGAELLADLVVGHGVAPGDLDPSPRKFSPPFFAFYGISKPPAEGSYGYFAVNPWTGDVWGLWGCHRLTSPALRKSQAEIRRRFTREEMKQYAKLHRLKPECIVELPERRPR